MSERARRLQQDVLAASGSGNDSDRKTNAVSVVDRLREYIVDRVMCIVDWEEYLVVPRKGWTTMETQYGFSYCSHCQRPIAKGEMIWILSTYQGHDKSWGQVLVRCNDKGCGRPDDGQRRVFEEPMFEPYPEPEEQ